MRTFVLPVVLSISFCAGTGLSAQQNEAAAPPLPDLHLVPADASAVIAVPHLKRTSNELETMFEGMERAHVLFGMRPIDQLRAMLDLTTGVREQGSAMAFFLSSEADAEPVFLIPVFDATDFLESNFDPLPDGAPNAFIHSSGNVVHARAVDGHVLLSRDAALIDGYEATSGFGAQVETWFGARGQALFSNADVVILARGGMAPALLERLSGRIPFAPRPLSFDFLAQADASAVALNFDPLGLGLNTLVALPRQQADAEGEVAAPAHQPRRTSTLDALPQKPFFIAAGADFADLAGVLPAPLFEAVGNPEFAAFLRSLKGVQLIVSPSALGMQGGLLNEGIIVIRTDEPQHTKALLRERLLDMSVIGPDINITPMWEEASREVEGVSVDAYQVATALAPDQAREKMAIAALFGARGLNGFVGTVDDAVIVTFSQRPDVFASAVKAAQGGESLQDDAVLRQMLEWLPPDPDLQVFLGVGQFGRVLSQIQQMLPQGQVALPAIDPSTNPVGFGMAVDRSLLETGIVAPADVLAIFVDAAIDAFERMNAGLMEQ